MQIALGAGFRQRALGVMPHIIGAIVVSLTVLLLGVFVLHAFPVHRTLRPAALTMLGITFLQVFLGVGAYLGRLQADQNPGQMVFTTVTHLAVGALTLASSIVLAIHIRRSVRPHAAETADSPHAAVTS
jgi:heme A synthase